jgi:hypothetical protein
VKEFLLYARKFLAAAAGAVAALGAAVAVGSDGGELVSTGEWVGVAIATLTALGVYSVPNVEYHEAHERTGKGTDGV